MENTIVGTRLPGGGVAWTVDGQQVRLEPSLAIRNHSPTGFEWGYAGSGPAQSALAILLHVLGIRNADMDSFGWQGGDAERLYQAFKFEYIAKLPQHEQQVEFTVDIEEWASRKLLFEKR